MIAPWLFPNNEEDPGPKIGIVVMILFHIAVAVVAFTPSIPLSTRSVVISTVPGIWFFYSSGLINYKRRKKWDKEQAELGMRYMEWVEAKKRTVIVNRAGDHDDKASP